VASCGAGSEAVQDTVININPASLGVDSSPTGIPTDVAYVVQTYQVELRSPSGYPQIGTNVTITNRGTLLCRCRYNRPLNVLCTGDYSIGQSAVCTDITKTPLPSTYVATTDSTGSVRFTMLFAFFPGSDGTVTDIEAYSGTGYDKSDIVFKCVALRVRNK